MPACTGRGTSVEDTAIVAAIIGLARALGRETIAEGIEQHTQASELRALGCQQGQGFLYAKPLAALDLEALLLTGEAAPGALDRAGTATRVTGRPAGTPPSTRT